MCCCVQIPSQGLWQRQKKERQTERKENKKVSGRDEGGAPLSNIQPPTHKLTPLTKELDKTARVDILKKKFILLDLLVDGFVP